jgi:hypothetical protein
MSNTASTLTSAHAPQDGIPITFQTAANGQSETIGNIEEKPLPSELSPTQEIQSNSLPK